MTGILILAHGSREKETEETLENIVGMVKRILGLKYVEKAFLQFSETNLEQGLNKLIGQGIKDIKVIPYFLFEGVHIKEDIPKEINEFLQGYSDVRITFGRTLGTDNRLAEVLADRVKEVI
ncbi:cobalamin (vitamin B12) biosynthesis CbiX protein [Syntrophobotulus glycolicus DSM 8271]|uniref:Cobalamin (Vitamin B12) biosynthesis CbiX protein n=1 Tax=Syntrophobotulus glycolicus (strain DSM 8271 / FlGlyR) TaxID=645991 RepID=F0SZ37_SYNGF|nr:CbiX/SirB N-terminal domain-containing protein [Syntrophobotulus glycolicus]ADY57155.1 cobalamin (vitamin B12) biosynthesis CbiX protein [Syntrophobotulus glycolicus DSM 8271]